MLQQLLSDHNLEVVSDEIEDTDQGKIRVVHFEHKTDADMLGLCITVPVD